MEDPSAIDIDIDVATKEPRDSKEHLQAQDDKRKAFWIRKRKKQREREKGTKVKNEISHTINKKWKDIDISQIEFYLPRICVDASFEMSMTDKEISSVGSQLMHAYGFFKRSSRPLCWYLTSFGGKLQERMSQFDGFSTWKIFIDQNPFHEIFDLSQIVYLSPESEDELTDLEEDKIYVIGAIADHNRLKGLSASHARSVGVRSARLPIARYLDEVPNFSLNINHVIEILVNFAADRDWRAALMKSVPTRKAFQKQDKETN